MKIGIDSYVLKYPLTGIGNVTYRLIRTLFELFPNEELYLLLEYGNIIDQEAEKYFENKNRIYIKSSIAFEHERINRMFQKIIYKLTESKLSLNIGFCLNYPFLKHSLKNYTKNLDVYHCMDWYLYPSQNAKLNVITIHDLATSFYPESQTKLCIEKEKLKKKYLSRYDKIVSVSDSTKNDLVQYYGIDQKKIQTVYWGIDPIFFDETVIQSKKQLLQKYQISSDAQYFFSLSTIEPRKNFKRVLEAFRIFKERNNENIYLVCAGAWGWKNDELKNYLDEYNLNAKVRFLGYVDKNDIPSLIRNSLGFIYLSLYEGFGLPILEAMSAKTPVIASNTSSMPEVVGDAGILVSPFEVEEVALAMEKIIYEPELSKKLVELGAKQSKKFSWEQTAKLYMDVYKSSL